MIHEREFFAEGDERWVLRLDRQLIGLSVVRYVNDRQEGPGVLFEEYLATGNGPPHKAFRKLVESLVPETAEYEVG
jgi:hypothetical protein